MKKINFMITLLQDVVISEHSATVGNHTSLDYLPGNVFLGLLASKQYADLSQEDAWTIFHSGKIRFHDALPLTAQGAIAWPMPLSLHLFKNESLLDEDAKLKTDGLFDAYLSREQAKFDAELNTKLRERQMQQSRKGYLTAFGNYYEPKRTFVMKTAIDPNKNTAATGQLFGYQAIKAGQRFCLQISADEDVADKLENISTWLCGNVRLGRSRSAQFGLVKISQLSKEIAEPISTTKNTDILTFWLVSDLALIDDFGLSTIVPVAKHFGLPDNAEFLNKQSYIRSREYSTYNGKRRSYDSQRQVICRGSVLRFKVAINTSSVLTIQTKQFGLHQASGLGRVLVNPQMLSTAYPIFEKIQSEIEKNLPTNTQVKRPDTILIHYLEQKYDKQHGATQIKDAATKLYKKMLAEMTKARTWLGLKTGQPFPVAPSTSQWGNVIDTLGACLNDANQARERLFLSTNCVIRSKQDNGWDLALNSNDQLGSWLQKQFEAIEHKQDAVQVFLHMAKLAQDQSWQAFIQGKDVA